MTKCERWFLCINPDRSLVFGMCIEDNVITFARDQDWMLGKNIKEVKPFLEQHNVKAIELKPCKK